MTNVFDVDADEEFDDIIYGILEASSMAWTVTKN